MLVLLFSFYYLGLDKLTTLPDRLIPHLGKLGVIFFEMQE